MKTTRIAFLFLVTCISTSALLAAPACGASSSASSKTDERDARLDRMAHELLDDLVAHRFEAAAKNFDDKMMAALPPAKLKEVAAQIDAQLGAFKTIQRVRYEDEMGYRTVILVSQYEKATVNVRVVFDGADKVAGLFFKPES